MAETDDRDRKQEAGIAPGAKLGVEDDLRLRYLGFDVGPKKIGDLFRGASEEQKYLAHVREKHERNDILRDTSNFREERISGTEKYILLAASAIVLLTFFLPVTPWISGHFETRTEIAIGKKSSPKNNSNPTADSSAALDSAGNVLNSDSATAVASTTPERSDTPASTPIIDKAGFQELQVKRTRTKIDKTPFKLSGAQILARTGAVASDVFSSGIALKLTGILFIVFVLSVFAVPLYVIYSVLTIKGDADAVALKLKKALRFGWYPALIWLGMLGLSVFGAEYGFDSSEALKQVGESYGIASFLGLIGSGLYVSLAGCIFAGAKSVEI